MKRLTVKSVVNTLLLLLIISSFSYAGNATEWNLDKAHSSVNFTIDHFVTPIHGKFDDYNIDINFDPENLEDSKINVSIQVASVKTGWEPRDKSLQTSDWFDTDKYDAISFESSKIISKGDGNYVAEGKLKIKGVEKDVELPFSLLGIKQIPEDWESLYYNVDKVASFVIHYSLNREDFNVGTGTSNQSTAAMLYKKFVTNEVKVYISVEAGHKISQHYIKL